MDSNERDQAIAILRRANWLGEGREDLIERFLDQGRIVRLAAGQWAQAEGDDETGVFVVLSGAVQTLCKAPGGREVLIGLGGPGLALGQTARFGGGPRLVTVICHEDCVLLQVSDRALARIAHDAPRVWEAVAALLYLQLRGLVQLLAETTALPPRQRLASRIELLARTNGASLRLSQQALGEMVGLTRKTVNGYLAQFERAGLIRRVYGELVVTDAAGLRRVAET
jgi:CRP/FNR family transcriptional regulator, cyclic AMP receptor protein